MKNIEQIKIEKDVLEEDIRIINGIQYACLSCALYVGINTIANYDSKFLIALTGVFYLYSLRYSSMKNKLKKQLIILSEEEKKLNRYVKIKSINK